MKRLELEQHLAQYLNTRNYQDYGPNGLQIEGKETVKKVAFAVSATKDSIAQTIAAKADTLIVHHGLFWKFHGVRTITGPFAKRVKPLIENNINLFGYHLPLDAHLETGNAAQLATELGLVDLQPFGDYKGMPTGVWGTFTSPVTPKKLKEHIEQVTDHQVIHSSPHNKKITTMGIITGGANGDWTHCLPKNIDSYLTGEMSEHDWHEAKESHIHMFAAGHNATERFGILALQRHLEETFSIKTIFIDSDNPA